MNPSKIVIQGLDEVEEEVRKIRNHKLSYTIFEVSKIDPVALHVVYSDGIDNSKDLRSTPAEEELLDVFTSCESKISSEKSYFIVYDFGYYNDKNNYRDMMVLISFIPESVNLRNKIAMSSNTGVLLNTLQIPMHIEIHEIVDFNYQRLKNDCSSIQRK